MLRIILLLLVFIYFGKSSAGDSIATIWNSNKYSAFTTLLHSDGIFYCAFREATKHRVNISDTTTLGKIVIIKSLDSHNWSLYGLIKRDSCDLRDPNLSISADGRIMLLFFNRSYATSITKDKLCSYVTFLYENSKMTDPQPIRIKGYNSSYRWLWKIKWEKGRAYGFMYGDDYLFLTSSDGVNYEILYKGELAGERLTETAIVFRDNKVIAVARGKNDGGFYGVSYFPFNIWNWKKMKIGLGGPDLLKLHDNSILLGTRNYQEELGKTSLYRLVDEKCEFVKTVVSTKDSSYPSFAQVGDTIYMSYYTGNNGKSDILLMKNEGRCIQASSLKGVP